jgi:hypothetical protein
MVMPQLLREAASRGRPEHLGDISGQALATARHIAEKQLVSKNNWVQAMVIRYCRKGRHSYQGRFHKIFG